MRQIIETLIDPRMLLVLGVIVFGGIVLVAEVTQNFERRRKMSKTRNDEDGPN